MPAGDRTGPWGTGPRTGRGLGYCTGYQHPGFMFPGPGLGYGRGFGFGRGFGRGMGFGRGRGFRARRFNPFWGYAASQPAPGFPMPGFASPFDPWGAAELTPEQELQFLKAEAERIRDELRAVEKRTQELETENK